MLNILVWDDIYELNHYKLGNHQICKSQLTSGKNDAVTIKDILHIMYHSLFGVAINIHSDILPSFNLNHLKYINNIIR